MKQEHFMAHWWLCFGSGDLIEFSVMFYEVSLFQMSLLKMFLGTKCGCRRDTGKTIKLMWVASFRCDLGLS